MSILTDLRAALDAALASEQMKGKAWDDFRDLLDTDTICALLDVAENAAAVRLSDICALMGDWYCESHSCDACGSVTDPCVLAPLRTMERALAQLVNEADHE